MIEAKLGQLVERTFETFSYRIMPTKIWREDHWEVDYYDKGFVRVSPREFDFGVFESHPFHSQSDTLHVMTVQGVLFYLPSFLALVLHDWQRSNDLDSSIMYALRGFVTRFQNLDNWIVHVRHQPSFDGSLAECQDLKLRETIEDLLNWFVLKVQPCQSALIRNMTRQECEVVAECLRSFDQALKIAHPWARERSKHLVESTCGILLDDSLFRRLGAQDEGDIVKLLCLLHMAEQKYPKCITRPKIDQIRKEINTTP